MRPHSGGRNKANGPVAPSECQACGATWEPWDEKCPNDKCPTRTPDAKVKVVLS